VKPTDERITRYNLGFASIGIPWKLLDPMQTTNRFEGIFLSCVGIYAFININHRNERNILSNL
jgi:hypothetical protein